MLVLLPCCRCCACCYRCYILLYTIIASIQFCESSYFKRLNFYTLVSRSHPISRNPTHPPVFIAPHNIRYRKMWFLYLNSRYSTIFACFLPVIKSNMNRFRNGFHSRIAFSKLYNIAAQSLSQHTLHCMKIIIETFLSDIRFPCISSVEAITIWISQDVRARRTEQSDTTYDFLGRKLTNLVNCIFKFGKLHFQVGQRTVLGRDIFLKIAITNPFFVRFRNGFDHVVEQTAL